MSQEYYSERRTVSGKGGKSGYLVAECASEYLARRIAVLLTEDSKRLADSISKPTDQDDLPDRQHRQKERQT